MAIKLIVGLRNPGDRYAETRHNAGAWFVEKLAFRHDVVFKLEKKLKGELAVLNVPACRFLLPTTFMNHSGEAVMAIGQFYQIHPSEMLIVHDELDLPCGTIRLKTGGGHGGHNGLRSIIQHLGAEFHRLRVGIGHPGHASLVHDYVLNKPSLNDREAMIAAIERALDLMPKIFENNFDVAMNQLHAFSAVSSKTFPQ